MIQAPDEGASRYIPPNVETPVLILACACGREIAARRKSGTADDARCGARRQPMCCKCGNPLGEWEGELLRLPPALPYWGEISSSRMQQLLRMTEKCGWQAAVRHCLPPSLRAYVEDNERAGFMDVLDWAPGSRLLEVGSGLGGISAALAREHHVVALEGVEERARFLALRARQQGLTSLQVVMAALPQARLAPAQFDGIILNGVLEWVGVWNQQQSPSQTQREFLSSVRALLRPGGKIYIGIENRFGWPEWRGAMDHSGLPYTSLMPRFLARWVIAGRSLYRSQVNFGYRTYTYSFYGYRRLFAAAGLRCRESWCCPSGYNWPKIVIPLHQPAINYGLGRHAPNHSARWRYNLKRQLGREWLWRIFGADFLFLLEPCDA